MLQNKMKSCDIVMPVYNNKDVLQYSLPALFNQKIPHGWQVRLIVVDDGSMDSTVQVIKEIEPGSKWAKTLIIEQTHAGAAIARNKGIEASQAEIIFFLGADIILCPLALEKHLNWHDQNLNDTEAVLGMVKWDPRLKPTPLMEWMVHGGQQNDFDELIGCRVASPKHCFYGSHLSLKRRLLDKEKFSEKFDGYGWEDLELGRRLERKNIKLNVVHEAVGLHRHFYTASQILKRQYATGQGIVTYQKLYSEEAILPENSNWKHWRRLVIIHSGLLSLLTGIMKKTSPKYSTPRLFLWVTALYFWQGVYSAKSDFVNKNNYTKA